MILLGFQIQWNLINVIISFINNENVHLNVSCDFSKFNGSKNILGVTILMVPPKDGLAQLTLVFINFGIKTLKLDSILKPNHDPILKPYLKQFLLNYFLQGGMV